MSLFFDKSKILFAQSIGSDLFEDPSSGRLKFPDPLNKYLFHTLFRDYVLWHETHHHFYPKYESDKRKLKFLHYTQFFWAAGGVLLAGMVINPNYTTPRAFWLRKFNVLLCAWLGFTFGMRNHENHKTLMQLRMLDYFPLEVKRALRTQDYRYLALFDYKNADRELFDKETGKSLS